MKYCCERYTFWITLAVSLYAYLNTVAPSIAGGDAGELVAEGCQLGTSHPPGYPLYTIIVHLATKYVWPVVPSDKSKAWVINCLSCFFGAIASALLASSIVLLLQGRKEGRTSFESTRSARPTGRKKMTERVGKVVSNRTYFRDFGLQGGVLQKLPDIDQVLHFVAGTTMGLLHSFSPLAWQYSITAEVFALHNCFVALIVYTSISFAREGSLKRFLQGAFVCGLALTNQHTSILLSIPMILCVIYATNLYNTKKWAVNVNGRLQNMILLAAGSFLSPLCLLYATLPLFATIYPHHGSWGNVTSILGFLNHFRRKDYGTLRLFSGNDKDSEGLVERIFLWGNDFFWEQGSPFVASCFLVGCIQILRKEQKRRCGKVQFQSKRNAACRPEKGRQIQSHLPLDGPNVESWILLSLGFYLLVFHSLANLPLNNDLYFGIHQRFWMHPNFLTFLIAGFGMGKFMELIQERCSNKLIFVFLMAVPLVLLVIPLNQGMQNNDQSNNYHFRNYARSILTTLPQNAILFINYDQQWTSIRYLQECEAVREDITSIHLGMMSYEWWEHKRDLYQSIDFPGTHYTLGNTVQWKNGGYTFSELLDANSIGARSIFIGGKPTFEDPFYQNNYEEIPFGIVNKIVKKNERHLQDPEKYRVETQKAWRKILHEYALGLPDKSRYGDESWEQTIVKEFYDHFVSRATHLLDLAVKSQEKDPKRSTMPALVEACAWLESARANDEMSSNSTGILKNLGLGYMNIVRNSESSFPPSLNENELRNLLGKDITEIWWDNNESLIDFKTWASRRWQDTWFRFLQTKDAEQDHSYEAVKSIYEAVTKTKFEKQREL